MEGGYARATMPRGVTWNQRNARTPQCTMWARSGMDDPARPGQACVVRPQEEYQARLRTGHQFATTLLGLDRRTAVRQVLVRGYRPHVIPVATEAVTLDSDSRRIRLLVDEDDIVVRTSAG